MVTRYDLAEMANAIGLPQFECVVSSARKTLRSPSAGGEIVLLDDCRWVIVCHMKAVVILSPIDEDSPTKIVKAGSYKTTGERWAKIDLLKHLLKMLEKHPTDGDLVRFLSAAAMYAGTQRSVLASVWLTTGVQRDLPNTALNFRRYFNWLKESGHIELIEDQLPQLALDLIDSDMPVVGRFLADESLWDAKPEDVTKALQFLEEALPDLAEFLDNEVHFEPFTPAFNKTTNEQVVVIGPCALDEECYVVITEYLDDAMVVYGPELDATDIPYEADDPQLAEIACEALNFPVCIHSLRNYELGHPSWNLAMAAALGQLYRKLCSDSMAGEAKRVLKLLIQRFKACSKEEKGKLQSILPELVNPARRGHPSLITLDDRTIASLDEVVTAALDKIYEEIDAEFSSLDEAAQAESDEERHEAPSQGETGPSNVVNLFQNRASATEITKASSEQDKKQRVLRAKINVTELLSLEWPLAKGDTSFLNASASTLSWLSERIGTTLPASWAAGVHEMELGGVRVQVAANDALFALRLEHPDSDQVARTWRLEAILVKGKAGAPSMAGLRMSTQDRTDLPRPFRSIPGLINAWRVNPGLQVVSGGEERHVVSSSFDMFRLRNEIHDAQRKHSLWVFRPEDAAAICKLPGLAQLWELGGGLHAEYESNLYPLLPGTWHIYPPGQPVPGFHQVADVRKQIDRAVTEACSLNRSGPAFRDALDFIRESTARELAAARGTASQSAAPEIHPEIISASSALQEQLDVAIGESDALRVELADALALVSQLKGKLHSLQAVSDQPVVPVPDVSRPAYPATLAGLTDWSQSLTPRIRFADKALRTASRIVHQTPDLIYASLQALHDHYWPMRWGEDPEAKSRWEQFLTDNRLRCGPVGHALENHRFSDAYQAVVDGRSMEMSLHIQGSSSRNPRKCLRIYFACDDDRKFIAVGALPIHLDSTHS